MVLQAQLTLGSIVETIMFIGVPVSGLLCVAIGLMRIVGSLVLRKLPPGVTGWGLLLIGLALLGIDYVFLLPHP